jgi:putative membrane protein insertion efficiency factor
VSPLTALLLLLVRAYRWLVSPLLPPACRFYPSCSAYAAAALERHGALKGSVLSARRLLRCHPFHAGGVDPVP